MMNFSRITVLLSQEELTALRVAADREFRNPREQARYLLRNALLGSPPGPPERNDNGAAKVSEAHGAKILSDGMNR